MVLTKILVDTDRTSGSHLAAQGLLNKPTRLALRCTWSASCPSSSLGPLQASPSPGDALSLRRTRDGVQELLDGQVEQLEEQTGGKVTKAYLKTGKPDAEVIELGEEIGADLIVVGSKGLTALRPPIGSVSSSIVDHGHCTMLVVRGE